MLFYLVDYIEQLYPMAGAEMLQSVAVRAALAALTALAVITALLTLGI